MMNTLPRSLRIVLMLTLGASLFSALTLKLPLPGIGLNLQSLLGLNPWGVSHGFVWQFVTHLFVQPIGREVSIGFLVNLIFNLYFLWILGQSIIEYKGEKHFLKLFFIGGILPAVVTSLILFSVGIPFFMSGSSIALYSMLTAWVFLFPDRQLLVFMMIPIQVKWLIAIALGSSLFMDLSNGNLLGSINLASAIGFGYFYGLLAFGCHSPYRSLRRFETAILRWKAAWQRRVRLAGNDFTTSRAKVYDFRTGKAIMDDETFLDVCLEKITKFGKRSLTIRERFRLWKISLRISKRS